MPNFINYTDEQIEALVNDVYKGVVTRDNLPVDLYKDIKRRLNKAVFEGFGGTYAEFSTATSDGLIMAGFEKNIAVFSGAKTFQQVNDMSNFLFAGKDKIPFSEFKNYANDIFDTYNDNWLKTEYNTALSQASSAQQWHTIKEQAEIFPLIKFITVGDERVRSNHKQLDEIVRPIGDPFWKHNFPPLDWNCRCTTEQLEEGDEELTDLGTREIPPVPKLFQMNAGEDKVIFDESVHPYFTVDKRYKVALGGNFGLPFVSEIKQIAKKVKKIPAPAVTSAKKASEEILKIKGLSELKSIDDQVSKAIDELNTAATVAMKASGEERLKLLEAYTIKKGEYNLLKVTQNRLKAENSDEIIKLIKVDNPLKINFDISAASIRNNRDIKRQVEQFNSIVSDTWAVDKRLKINVGKNIKRASFSKRDGVKLSPTSGIETVLHEIGHFLEHERLDLHAEIMTFYNRRTAKDAVQRLSVVTGNRGYGITEITKTDDFIDPYIGKIYNSEGASEVLTMWFTELMRNPTRLIEKDYEYFEFIFNLLRK